eukprot:2555150-Pleurochrysis_carterae.AAC.1
MSLTLVAGGGGVATIDAQSLSRHFVLNATASLTLERIRLVRGREQAASVSRLAVSTDGRVELGDLNRENERPMGLSCTGLGWVSCPAVRLFFPARE